MKVLLVGGGTMGSVSPLIAVYEQIKKSKPKAKFLFLGTKDGPECQAVDSYDIDFRSIPAGKLRRYFSWQNLIDPFKLVAAFFKSLVIIFKFKPQVVMIAGSFVGVPVTWAAWCLRVPILIHQQDIIAGLANKLMANTARKITVSFEVSLKDFSPTKTILTGNPVREEFYSCDPDKGRVLFQLKDSLPVLLVVGGGTGAVAVNQVVAQALPELLKFCQVIHITGRGKKVDFSDEDYHQFEFLTNEMREALCAADLVVSRAGMSTLSELIILARATILIPIADSHQEYNARYFQSNNAVVSVSQNSLTKEMFVSLIREVLFDRNRKSELEANISQMMKVDGAKRVAELLLQISK